jgi:hypothetical protein
MIFFIKKVQIYDMNTKVWNKKTMGEGDLPPLNTITFMAMTEHFTNSSTPSYPYDNFWQSRISKIFLMFHKTFFPILQQTPSPLIMFSNCELIVKIALSIIKIISLLSRIIAISRLSLLPKCTNLVETLQWKLRSHLGQLTSLLSLKHSYDILGARMLWKPKEARILKNLKKNYRSTSVIW